MQTMSDDRLARALSARAVSVLGQAALAPPDSPSCHHLLLPVADLTKHQAQVNIGSA